MTDPISRARDEAEVHDGSSFCLCDRCWLLRNGLSEREANNIMQSAELLGVPVIALAQFVNRYAIRWTIRKKERAK